MVRFFLRGTGWSPLVLGLGIVFSAHGPASAHEVGAPFSGAIIDPLVLHHAHIENEQRVNFFYFRGVEGFRGRKRTAFDAELELGWSNSAFKFGGELFLPVAVRPSLESGARVIGIGDLNLRPIKYALVNKPDFIITTASQFVLPTGSERRGFGEGNTEFAQALFVDKAVGNWFAGVNLEPHINISGEPESGLEYGVVLSYSFIKGTRGTGLASPRPQQKWVISPSVEFIGEAGFRGERAGRHSTTFTGIQLSVERVASSRSR